MQTIEERFGNLIRYHLKVNNMTQQQLGNRIGVTQRSISAYINAKQQPSLGVVYSICKELNIDVNDVFGLHGESDASLSKYELKIIENYRLIDMDEEEKYKKYQSIVELLETISKGND